jgi:hypothetical protein
MLSGAVLIAYKFLRKKILSIDTVNTGLKIYALVKSAGLADILARCAAAQACHETADPDPFTSAIFKSNNNCFGMKFAGQSTAIGVKNGYANYTNIEQSVTDWSVWWMKHRGNIFSFPLIVNSIESYVRFLKNQNYFEASEAEYLDQCQKFYNLLFG